MKRIVALLLAAVLCMSLTACGSGNSTPVSSTETEYAIGEAFGTDNVECTVMEIKWVTPDDFLMVSKRKSGSTTYGINTESLFPGSQRAFGYLGVTKHKFPINTFSL